MEYGHTTNIEGIDFILPPDHPSNSFFIQKVNIDLEASEGRGPSSVKQSTQTLVSPPASDVPRSNFIVKTGCAKWGIKEWVGMLYPAGTKDSEYLSKYSQCFNSVELNTTGYRFGSARIMKEWADETPDGFTFSPKFPQPITQFKLLGDVQEQTDRFVESLSGFGEKLGRPFLLMPARFTPARMDKIEAFFDKIPKGFPISFELRHPDFYKEENKLKVAEILRKHNTPWVITDSAGERGVIHQVITSDTIFIRFSGCDNPEVDKRRINDWVDRLGQWHTLGVKEVYWYAHNIPEEKTPIYAAYFILCVNERLGTSLSVPEVPAL